MNFETLVRAKMWADTDTSCLQQLRGESGKAIISFI